jgi:MFS family permease
MIGLAIFGLGSLASSLAQTATQLIIFRCFTGLGGGGLMTVAQMIVSDVVPLRERGKYQGILVSRSHSPIFWLTILFTQVVCLSCQASDIPFQYGNRPLIVIFWFLGCGHCIG